MKNVVIKIVKNPYEETYNVYCNCELIMECLTEDEVEQLTEEEILKVYDND